MEPEKDNGNIEYKLKLINKTEERIQNLTTQMKFRCDEGNGECIYNIGVSDDGTMNGITQKEYEETYNFLDIICKKNNYILSLLTKTFIKEDKYIYEFLIRENNIENYINIKVAIAGNVDSGKSTFLSVLTYDKLDDGRGSARVSIFNYPHEVKTGRTSSIGHQILGFDCYGNVINYKSSTGKLTWPEIIKKSAKVISFFDTAGHAKYLKTTILGLSCSQPDVCFIMVSANKGLRDDETKKDKIKHQNMTKEHIFLCITLNIPFVIIVTKIDMMEDRKQVLKDTMDDIQKIIKCPGIRRQPIKVENKDDVLICAKQIHTESIVPIFNISNTTGFGFDNVKLFLNLVSNTTKQNNSNVEYIIDTTWSVTGFGTVIGGHLISGIINVNDKLLIGPNNGNYEEITIRSIHSKRVPLQTVKSGSYVCLGLKKYNRSNVKSGNVIIGLKSPQIFCNKFSADIKILKAHSTTIRIGYEPVLHIANIRQSVRLIHIKNKINSRNPDKTKEDDILRTGDMASVTFIMCYKSEYIKQHMKFLLCEGTTKVIGTVTQIY